MAELRCAFLADHPEHLGAVAQWLAPRGAKDPAGPPERPPEPVRFYGFAREHGVLDPMHPSAFELGGVRYLTLEHYYQAMKNKGTPLERAIVDAPSGDVARMLGQSNGPPEEAREQWLAQRADVMRKGLEAKFGQNEVARAELLATGTAPLCFADPTDEHWGEGAEGAGSNALGELLEELRAVLSYQDALKRAAEATNRFHAPLALLALQGDRALGVLRIDTHPRERRPSSGAPAQDPELDGIGEVWVSTLYVDPEHRRRGVARALVQHAVKVANHLCLGQLHALVSPVATAAAVRAGWEVVERYQTAAGELVLRAGAPCSAEDVRRGTYCYDTPPPTRESMLVSAVATAARPKLIPVHDTEARAAAVAPAEDVAAQLERLAAHPRAGGAEHERTAAVVAAAAERARETARRLAEARLSVTDISHVPAQYILAKLDTSLSLATVPHALKRLEHSVQSVQVQLDMRAHEQHNRGMPDQEAYLAPSNSCDSPVAVQKARLDFLRRGAAQEVIGRVISDRERAEQTILREAEEMLQSRVQQLACQQEQLDVLGMMAAVERKLSSLAQCRECSEAECGRSGRVLNTLLEGLKENREGVDRAERAAEDAHAVAARLAKQYDAESARVCKLWEQREQALEERCRLWEAEAERLRQAVAHDRRCVLPLVRQARERAEARRDRQQLLELRRGDDLAAFRQHVQQQKDKLDLGRRCTELLSGYVEMLRSLVADGTAALTDRADRLHRDIADSTVATHQAIYETYTHFQVTLRRIIMIKQSFIGDIDSASRVLQHARSGCPTYDEAYSKYGSALLELADMRSALEGDLAVLQARVQDTAERIWHPTKRVLEAARVDYLPPEAVVRAAMRRRGAAAMPGAEGDAEQGQAPPHQPRPPSARRASSGGGARWAADTRLPTEEASGAPVVEP
eukprot:TRINITY_DN50038_c0_g1_i1.p1 TRINITY_DN50038_c0_g1~~TRINITY_DN50038_c0_g1_i1.p1  ORF type:complete len:918 (+),score=255.27 TRINITY_DN50038_c0_g1_i1:83-2836(+)